MKAKNLVWAMAFAVVSVATSCNSKPQEKAEDVQDKREDVIEAQREGDTSEVREEQAELDSARKDYREAVKDSIKKQ
jgi:ribosome-binding protein aMBF1 (putative translation factor)